LRLRVHGASDFPSFHVIGAHVARDLDAVLEAQQPSVSNQAHVLDFGCGCGRVLTRVKRRHPGWRMSGSDIDAAAIDWCRDISLTSPSSRSTARGRRCPPTRAVLTWCMRSRCTHLPEDLQLEWLEELNRITRLGGLLLLSVHPMGLADAGARNVRARWTRYFEIADILPRRINNHQDLVVARPRASRGLRGVLARFTGRSGNR
jgi:SAM-dependent methyltransferase